MVEQKTINASTLGILGVLILSLIVPGFFDKPKYYCEDRPDIGLWEFDGFSKYYSLEYGKGLNGTQDGIIYSNKLCRTGWELVIDDRIIVNDTEEESQSTSTDVAFIYEGKTMIDMENAVKEINKQYPSSTKRDFNCITSMNKCCVVDPTGITNKCATIKLAVVEVII